MGMSPAAATWSERSARMSSASAQAGQREKPSCHAPIAATGGVETARVGML